MRKKYYFIFISVLILISFGIVHSNSTNLKKYLNSGTNIDSYAKNFMPAIKDLPEYQNISFKYNHFSLILLGTGGITLVVKYNEETFENEKKKLAEKYKYLDHKVLSNFDRSKYYIPEYEFSINNYIFKVVDSSENYQAEYPKSFGMIGISEEEKSIAYLYFLDLDLDYIEEDNENPMAVFVKKNFKYDF